MKYHQKLPPAARGMLIAENVPGVDEILRYWG
jgi:hypothetical protein